ncbi:hypothetical protein IJD34_05435 [bacterium]|nr:hypothetical protein [bacterium]
MSNNINLNLLRNFITQKVGTTLDAKEAKNLGIEDEYTEAIDENDIDILIDDIVDEQGDLYEQFAVMYVTERDQQKAAKDKDEEKREQTQIKDKSGAGV